MSFTAVTVGLASVSLVLRSTCQALDNVCPGGVQVLFVLGSDIMHDHYSLLQHCGSKMWQIRGGGLFIVTMSSAMLFNMRVKRWGTCATGVQVKISKDLIGQVVGKARCLASGQHM